MRFLVNRQPSAQQQRRLAESQEVSFLPMEGIGEDGQLDLSTTRDRASVANGYTQFFDGDVIVAKITPCFENGKGALVTGLLNGIGFGTTELHVLSPGAELDARFLYYVTKSVPFRQQGEAAMTGAAGQKRVPEEFVRDYPVPVLALREQRAVADFLNRETARLDALMAEKDRWLELLAEKRRALITRAVTRGLNPAAPLRDSGLAWLGQVPANWDIKKLNHVASLQSGDAITAEDISESGDYPVFGGNGIRGYSSQFNHEGNYVLIGRQGALCGNINYATGRFWASEHAVVGTIRGDDHFTWLGELLSVMNLNQYSQSAAQPGLAVDPIANLSIPVPPVPEQRAIVAYFSAETAKLDGLRAATERTIGLLKERQAIARKPAWRAGTTGYQSLRPNTRAIPAPQGLRLPPIDL